VSEVHVLFRHVGEVILLVAGVLVRARMHARVRAPNLAICIGANQERSKNTCTALAWSSIACTSS
jgi:hypothetical protein